MDQSSICNFRFVSFLVAELLVIQTCAVCYHSDLRLLLSFRLAPFAVILRSAVSCHSEERRLLSF